MISGQVRALNLTVPLGSGRVGSDDRGYGPGSGFSFEPVQTSSDSSVIGAMVDGNVCVVSAVNDGSCSLGWSDVQL